MPHVNTTVKHRPRVKFYYLLATPTRQLRITALNMFGHWNYLMRGRIFIALRCADIFLFLHLYEWTSKLYSFKQFTSFAADAALVKFTAPSLVQLVWSIFLSHKFLGHTFPGRSSSRLAAFPLLSIKVGRRNQDERNLQSDDSFIRRAVRFQILIIILNYSRPAASAVLAHHCMNRKYTVKGAINFFRPLF